MKFIRSIKFRLTIWYLVVLMVLLILFATFTYLMLSNSLYQGIDDSLKLDVEQLETSIEPEDTGSDFKQGDQFGFDEHSFELMRLYDTEGSLVLAQGWGQSEDNLHTSTLITQALAGRSLYTTEVLNGREMRLYAVPFEDEPAINGVLVVGRSTSQVKDVLERFRYIIVITGLTMITIAGGCGLFMANRAFKPIEKISQTAREIEENDLSKRIDVHSEDELGRLASILNQMISRLERAFSRQRQFTADASHELRTPLAVIQAESTLSLRKERKGDDYRKSLELISREAAQMSALVDKLLFLARIDSGKEHLNLETVDLSSLITDLASETEVLCQNKGLIFRVGPMENLAVKGDKVELKQLFLNLLNNAIRYTSSGGTILVSVERQGDTAVVSVTDSGTGIPEEHIPHIFERFYRVHEDRSRTEGGAGLGLSICQHIAQSHGGRIEVVSKSGEGSTFSVSLPILKES
jgi:heavy metal sensor kinase